MSRGYFPPRIFLGSSASNALVLLTVKNTLRFTYTLYMIDDHNFQVALDGLPLLQFRGCFS